LQQEIHQVAEVADAIIFMTLVHPSSDMGSAIGNIYSIAPQRESQDLPVQLLATNDMLRVLWASPSGHLWVGTSDRGFWSSNSTRTMPDRPGQATRSRFTFAVARTCGRWRFISLTHSYSSH